MCADCMMHVARLQMAFLVRHEVQMALSLVLHQAHEAYHPDCLANRDFGDWRLPCLSPPLMRMSPWPDPEKAQAPRGKKKWYGLVSAIQHIKFVWSHEAVTTRSMGIGGKHPSGILLSAVPCSRHHLRS
jgi:hypothetical protein